MGNYKLVMTTDLIDYSIKKELTLNELILLTYFDNSYDLTLNLDIITKVTSLDKPKILEAFNGLLSKKIINLSSEKDPSGKIIDMINLDNLYNEHKEIEKKKEQEKTKGDIFSKFESFFGRPLSSSEIEIIKLWVEKLYSEELILCALDEANYNGVATIRYIDKVLYEWNKKGFKTKEDVDNYLKNRYDHKLLEETNIFDYNWLEDNDK